MKVIEAEPVEPNKTIVRSIRRNLKDLEEDEVTDLIYTTTVAAGLSRNEEGRKTQISILLGLVGLASKHMDEDELDEVIEGANGLSLVVQEHVARIQLEKCKTCPDHGSCLGEEPEEPPIIH